MLGQELRDKRKGEQGADAPRAAHHGPCLQCPLLVPPQGSFLTCQYKAVLFGLQTLQGEFLKSFFFIAVFKKKKKAEAAQ